MNLRKFLPPPCRLLMLFFGIVIPLFIAGEIAEYVFERERFLVEQPLMMAVHRHTADWMLPVAIALHWISIFPVAAAISILIAWYEWRNRMRRQAIFVLLGTALSAALMFAAKIFFNRPRPEFWPRIVEQDGLSFPSGHSTFSAALAVTVILISRRSPYRAWIAFAAVSFALLTGISRVVLGVHYPTDVLVGWITGMSTVIGIYHILFKPARR